MLNWFKKQKENKYPGFWNTYMEYINNQEDLPYEDTTFIVFDTETTGFHPRKDRVLSIGAIKLKNNTIDVQDSFELYIKQEIYCSDAVEIHGILKEGRLEKVSEKEALKQFLKYVKGSIIIAHHTHFDYSMINQMLFRLDLPELQNKCIDTEKLYLKSKHKVYEGDKDRYSLDDLCKELNIEVRDRHTASGDSLLTAIAFQKIVQRMSKDGYPKVTDLLL